MTREIKLSQGLVTIVDDADFDQLSAFKWCAVKSGNTYYAMRHELGRSFGNRIALHRQLLNPPKGMVCDHLDRNGLNNTRANLRLATRSQNAANSCVSVRNKTGFKGVSRSHGRYRASIRVKGKSLHLGTFETIDEAARAYAKAAAKHFGVYAREETLRTLKAKNKHKCAESIENSAEKRGQSLTQSHCEPARTCKHA